MSGSVIRGTSTTLGLDHPATKVDPDWHERGFGVDPRFASVLKVYDPQASDVDVVIDLQDAGKPMPSRIAFAALTREEARLLMAAIIRATDIDPLELLQTADAQYLSDALGWAVSSAQGFTVAFGEDDAKGLDILSGAAEMQARLDGAL